MEIDRNTATVVLYGNRVVFVDSYFYMCTITGKGFVNGVVYYLVDQVMQAFFADVADIHGGAFTNGLQSFQHLDTAGRVVASAVLCQFFTHVFSSFF